MQPRLSARLNDALVAGRLLAAIFHIGNEIRNSAERDDSASSEDKIMLQAVQTTTNPPQMISARSSRPSRRKLNRATSIVDCTIAPVAEEADLVNELLHMKDENDIAGAISLYDALIASADAFIGIENQPRCTDRARAYLSGEWERATCKAYQVADVLRHMRPDNDNLDRWTETLISCSFKMGHHLSDTAVILAEAASYRAALRGATTSGAAPAVGPDPILALIADRDAKEELFHIAYNKTQDAFEANRDAKNAGRPAPHSQQEIDALNVAADEADEVRTKANARLAEVQPTTPSGAARLLTRIMTDDPDINTPWHEAVLKALPDALEVMEGSA